MNKINRLILILGSGVILFAFQNCSDVKFAPGTEATVSKIADNGGLDTTDRGPGSSETPNNSGSTNTGTGSSNNGGNTTNNGGTTSSNDTGSNNNPPPTPVIELEDTTPDTETKEDEETEVADNDNCENLDQEDPNRENCSHDDDEDSNENEDSEEDTHIANVCGISKNDLANLILKVNVKAAYLDQTPVKVMTGSQNLLQLSEGEVGILTTSEVSAHQLRLELESEGNEIVGAGDQNIRLQTPSGQQSGIKINLGQGQDSVHEFEGVKAYVVRFVLDTSTQVVSAGKSGKCILKPVLRATEVVAQAE